MASLGTLTTLTKSLLLAGSFVLSCSNPTPIYPVNPNCATSSCEEPSEESPVPEPERFCPEGKDGDAYWRLPDGTLGDLAEDCSAEQICLGGLCAKLGTFAFVSDRSGEAEIYLQEEFLAPLQLTTTIPGVSPQSPDWSPNSECMVFELMEGYHSHLHVLCLDGTGYQLTSTPGYNSHPSYTPTGEGVVFSSTLGGSWNLYARKIEGTDLNDLSSLTTLFENNYGGVITVLDPDVCPVSDWIVFRCDYIRLIDEDNFSENSEICKIRKDGTDFTRLTTSEHAGDDTPACSPDGTEVAFASSRYDAVLQFGNDDIYVMDIDGNNERRITDNPASEFTPAFSSDGKLIGYEKYVRGDNRYFRDLWITDREGKEHLQLTSNPGNEYDIAWKP